MPQTIRQRTDLHLVASRGHFAAPNDTHTSHTNVVVSKRDDFASEISAQTNERAAFTTFYSDPGEKPQSWILRAYRWLVVIDPDVPVILILCAVVGALLGMLLWWMRG